MKKFKDIKKIKPTKKEEKVSNDEEWAKQFREKNFKTKDWEASVHKRPEKPN